MKRKIKINRKSSILYTPPLSLSLSAREYFLFVVIPIVEIDSMIETFDEWSKFTTWNGERKVERILAREFFVSIRKSIVKIPGVGPSKRQKKGRNGEINSDPGQNGRLESHYLAITVQNTHLPFPSFNNARCSSDTIFLVLLLFPKIFFPFFIFIPKKKWTYFL